MEFEIEEELKLLIGNDTPSTWMGKVFGFSKLSKFVEFEPESLENVEKNLQNLSKKIRTSKLTFCGEGYYPVEVNPILFELILLNPSWHSPYTPYQPEISQGRLEMLYLFQEFFRSFTNLDISVATLLDLGSALADGIRCLRNWSNTDNKKVLLLNSAFDSLLAVLRNRLPSYDFLNTIENAKECFAFVAFFPDKYGDWCEDLQIYTELTKMGLNGIAVVDPYFLIFKSELIKSLPLKIIVGSAQRLGLPMWGGGPYPAFFVADKQLLRFVPGRIVGITYDAKGHKGFRLSLQTREQHIRRDKATSNICTSQSLTGTFIVANLLLLGREKLLKKIVKVLSLCQYFLNNLNLEPFNKNVFDTISFNLEPSIQKRLTDNSIYFYKLSDSLIRFSFSDIHSKEDIDYILKILNITPSKSWHSREIPEIAWPQAFVRAYSELELSRFLKKREDKDYTLRNGSIPLGSCTMKHNPISCIRLMGLKPFTDIHPYQPKETLAGLNGFLKEMRKLLYLLIGYKNISFHPNSGAQAELFSLLAIKNYFYDSKRRVILIPESAHGTNFASAAMLDFTIHELKVDSSGSLNFEDLKRNLTERVAAVMITFPSTYGVFDPRIIEINKNIKKIGAFSYLDGANFNAFVGWLKPSDLGFDICHFNLHKTFAVPHGGGGPGAAVVCFSDKLKNSVPKDFFNGNIFDSLTTNSSPWGNLGALLVSYAYIKSLGIRGLKTASLRAVLKANYLMNLVSSNYSVYATNKNGLVGHEFILDLSEMKYSCFDIAKRLIDYGFHPPTVAWPVKNSLMFEPTESEPISELEELAAALISIKKEMESSWLDSDPLKNAPHAFYELFDEWPYTYSKDIAFKNFTKNRFISPLKRLDEALGDRSIVSSCLC